MATVVHPGRAQLRRLAQQKAAAGCVLSVYVDLDPSEFATGPARSSALTSAADEASRAIEDGGRALSHDARLRLREDVERIRSYAAGADFDGTHGLAIFAAAGSDLFEVLHLPRPVANAVFVDGAPHVTPLVGEPDGSWCVALVNRRDARLLCGGPLGLSEDERIEDDVPGRHDQGGMAQARFQRSIDEQARRHLANVASALAVRCRHGEFDHLLGGGPEEAWSEFVELLDEDVRARLRGRVGIDVERATVAEVGAAAAPAMREHAERVRGDLLARLQEGVGTGGRAAAGLDEVLGCLDQRRVEVLLLDAAFAVARPGVVEPAIRSALLQDADVLRLADRPELALHGGVAALLRF